MSRKNQSTFEELIDLTSRIPWWAGLLLAMVSYFLLHPFAQMAPVKVVGPNQFVQALSSQVISVLATILQYVLPAALGLGTLISGIRQLRGDLLHRKAAAGDAASLHELSWREFEWLVAAHFRQGGYTVTETPEGADGGVDLVLRKNGELALVQCKQWKAFKVGVKVVREFYGVMVDRGAAQGYIVTSGRFTNEAQDFANGKPITLIGGEALHRLLRQSSKHAVPATPAGHAEPQVRPVTNSNPSCPRCGGEMVLRTARQGTNAGRRFWGCKSYPRCKGTVSIRG